MNNDEITEQKNKVVLWNPNAAANWSFLFSPIFGGILQSKNWKELGDESKSKQSMIWVYISCLIILVSIFSPSLQQYSNGIGFLWLITWYFMSARSQVKFVKEKFNNEYEKKGWLKPIAIAISIIIGGIGLVSLGIVSTQNSQTTKMVKGGKLSLCPNSTVEEMVDSFIGDPSWESGTTDNDIEFVNINGNIMFKDKKSQASIQFIVSSDHKAFNFGAFEINGKPQAKLIAGALLKKMCESATK